MGHKLFHFISGIWWFHRSKKFEAMKAGKSTIRPWLFCQYNENTLVDLLSSVAHSIFCTLHFLKKKPTLSEHSILSRFHFCTFQIQHIRFLTHSKLLHIPFSVNCIFCTFHLDIIRKLEIKPCGLGSRIRDVCS